MSGDVITAFRRAFESLARQLQQESGVVWLVPNPRSGAPPSVYHGLLTNVEHFERAPDGSIRATRTPIPFSIEIPDDYCSAVDETLMLRVASVQAPIVHPNVSATGIVCLGSRFRPATRLRPLLEHLYRILAGRVWAGESPLDRAAADFFRRHPERVRALRAAPLWRRAVAARVRVEPLAPRPEETPR